MKHLFILFLSVLSCLAQAQPVKSATSDELIEKLAVPYANTRSLTTRNLEPQPRSLDLVIQFEFDSAKLKTESKPLLDNLSTALKSDRLKSIQFKVEGHTDAKGTETYSTLSASPKWCLDSDNVIPGKDADHGTPGYSSAATCP